MANSYGWYDSGPKSNELSYGFKPYRFNRGCSNYGYHCPSVALQTQQKIQGLCGRHVFCAKKAFDKIFKVTKEIFGKIIDFFKKDWKQVLFLLPILLLELLL